MKRLIFSFGKMRCQQCLRAVGLAVNGRYCSLVCRAEHRYAEAANNVASGLPTFCRETHWHHTTFRCQCGKVLPKRHVICKCRVIRYCTAECQLRDFPRHIIFCRTFKKKAFAQVKILTRIPPVGVILSIMEESKTPAHLWDLFDTAARFACKGLLLLAPDVLVRDWATEYAAQWKNNRVTLESRWPVWEIDPYLDYFDAIDKYVESTCGK